jgi:hypothetical protein
MQQIEEAITGESISAYHRFVMVRGREEKWVLGFGRIDLCRESDVEEGPRYEYLNAKTLASKMSGREFLRQFRYLFSGEQPYLVDGVRIDPVSGRWELREHRSDRYNDYALWPCLHAELQVSHHAIDSVSGPFASARGFPYFDNAYELVNSISQFRTFHFGRDSRRQNLHLILWKYRGRFSSFSFQDGSLQINVEGQFIDQLQVSGRIAGFGWEHPFNCPARNQLSLSIRDQPRRIEAALVAKNDEIVDLIRDEFSILGQNNESQPIAEIVDRCLHQGENVAVEYKPFVNLSKDGEGKREEIIRTALAMANTQGGHILLGVDDQGIPNFLRQGIPDPNAWKAIVGYSEKKEQQGIAFKMPDGREEIEEKVLRHGVQLRDFIQKRSNRSLLISVDIYFKESSPILVLRIEPGEDKPYMDVRDHSVWFRANATNRRPTEAELESLIREKEDRYDSL